MGCQRIKVPGGGAIVCSGRGRGRSPGPCIVPHCDRAGVALCDYVVAEGESCDVILCSRHAQHYGADTDFCPYHAQQAARGAA